MAKKEIKLGFVGLGFIGTIHSIACFSMPLLFKNLPFEVKLGPVYKNNIEDIPHFFEKGVKSIEEMLEDGDLDAVDICTPNYLHYEQAMKVIDGEALKLPGYLLTLRRRLDLKYTVQRAQ